MAREFAKAFYKSKEWQQVREFVRMRDKYLCVKCGAVGEEVHHIVHLTADNIWDTSITLNPNNLELLCYACHKKEHIKDVAYSQTKDKAKLDVANAIEQAYMFDANGNIIPCQ